MTNEPNKLDEIKAILCTVAEQQVALQKQQERSQLPSIPCIYFAIDSLGTVQYIGRSVNPQQRWSMHSCRRSLEAMGGIRIAYIQCSSELIDEVELCLIHWFQPPLNRQGIKKPRQTNVARIRQIKDIEVPGLGERIKVARIAISNEKSLEQICEEVGLSRTYWYDLEKESLKGTLSLENFRKIEAALRIDLGVSFND